MGCTQTKTKFRRKKHSALQTNTAHHEDTCRMEIRENIGSDIFPNISLDSSQELSLYTIGDLERGLVCAEVHPLFRADLPDWCGIDDISISGVRWTGDGDEDPYTGQWEKNTDGESELTIKSDTKDFYFEGLTFPTVSDSSTSTGDSGIGTCHQSTCGVDEATSRHDPPHTGQTTYVRGTFQDISQTGDCNLSITEDLAHGIEDVTIGATSSPDRQIKEVKPQHVCAPNMDNEAAVPTLSTRPNQHFEITLSSDGTNFHNEDMQISGSIPPGALASDQTLQFSSYPANDLRFQLDPHEQFLSEVYEFLPHGIRFEAPIVVRIPHSGKEAECNPELHTKLKIKLLYSNTPHGEAADWEEVDSSHSSDDRISAIITAHEVYLCLKSFCLFTVVGESVPTKFVDIRFHGKFIPKFGILKLTVDVNDCDQGETRSLIDMGKLIEQQSLRIRADFPKILISVENDDGWRLIPQSPAKQALETHYAFNNKLQKALFVMRKNSESHTPLYTATVRVEHDGLRTIMLCEDVDEMIQGNLPFQSNPDDGMSDKSSLLYGNLSIPGSRQRTSAKHRIRDLKDRCDIDINAQPSEDMRREPDREYSSETPNMTVFQGFRKEATVERTSASDVRNHETTPATTCTEQVQGDGNTSEAHSDIDDYTTLMESRSLTDTYENHHLSGCPQVALKPDKLHNDYYLKRPFSNADLASTRKPSGLEVSVRPKVKETELLEENQELVPCVDELDQTRKGSHSQGSRTLVVNNFFGATTKDATLPSEYVKHVAKPPKLVMEVKVILSRKLNTNRFDGKDWRSFAEQLGFGLYIGQIDKHIDPTWLLLQTWETMDDEKGTVDFLIKSLKAIDREDAANILSDYRQR